MSKVYEVNFDGLIGPTHNFSGLAYGNTASLLNRFSVSHPKKAALEGLAKMKLLHSIGIKQGFFPPPLRPNINMLRQKGFNGSDDEILLQVSRDDPELLITVSSASSMWTANAATVTPSVDTFDGKVHMTPANLISNPHRALESEETYQILQRVFYGNQFEIHPPLSDSSLMLDEGAANHMRLSARHGEAGIHVFVYGCEISKVQKKDKVRKFPVRQSLEASRQIVLDHQIDEGHVIFVQQNPVAIDAGVFHNDVIATSNQNVLLIHEQAYIDTLTTIEEIESKFYHVTKQKLQVIKISSYQLSLQEAVTSYLFNSQIVTRPDGSMLMIAPLESKKGKAKDVIDSILMQDNPVNEVHFVSLKESMANGGGPACLRLRVMLTEEELQYVSSGFLLDEKKIVFLEELIRKNYRNELHMRDLALPQLLAEAKEVYQTTRIDFN